MSKQALVILSGGQDSVTCLGWAGNRFGAVHAVSFDYQQKHRVELDYARSAFHLLGKGQHHVFDVPVLRGEAGLAPSALNASLPRHTVNDQHPDNKNLPASFVPGRNATFLLLAHMLAGVHGYTDVIAGFCQTDFSGYPDCREDFARTYWAALNLGYNRSAVLHLPLMHLTKAQTFQLAKEEDCLHAVTKYSLTCYNGVENLNEWGRGCGTCPACKLRINGYTEFLNTLAAR